MNFVIVLLFISSLAQAQLPSFAKVSSLLKDKSTKVMAACKNDQKNLKGCESYTEFEKLKECLLKNKDSLSPECKKSLL